MFPAHQTNVEASKSIKNIDVVIICNVLALKFSFCIPHRDFAGVYPRSPTLNRHLQDPQTIYSHTHPGGHFTPLQPN